MADSPIRRGNFRLERASASQRHKRSRRQDSNGRFLCDGEQVVVSTDEDIGPGFQSVSKYSFVVSVAYCDR